MRRLFPIAVLTVLSLSAALSGCAATASSGTLGAGQAAGDVQPFAGLPGPAPTFDANYDTSKIWIGEGTGYYSSAQLQQCKSLGLQNYLVRLVADPTIGQAQMSMTKIHCSWTHVEADVDAPISVPASQGWVTLVGGSADGEIDLGSVSAGMDSDVIRIPLMGGGARYFGTVKTGNASYYLSIFDYTNGKVPDAFYKGAIAEMMGQMVKSAPSLAGD